jgi:glycosyltransferase involved in cell wall biosynthesis
MTDVDLSIVAPAHDEEANIAGLVDDVRRALEGAAVRFEMIVVDDGSRDGTRAAIASAMAAHPWLRGLALAPVAHGAGNGQSAAFRAGIAAARGTFVALMDADRQNDPGDIPAMLDLLRRRNADVVQGDRTADRHDRREKRIASRIGRMFCRVFLGDTTRDTGCSLRILRREVAAQLPLQYRGMHRFIPYYARLLGYDVVELPVRHRARTAGSTHYGIGDRALSGVRDILAVRWMRSRLREPRSEPIVATTGSREPRVEESETVGR